MLNANVVGDYGDRVPDQYGGCFVEAGVMLVALFTADLDRHESALSTLVPCPEALRVRRTARSWTDVERDNRELAEALWARADLGVVATGIGMSAAGEFVVRVELAPWDEA